MTLAAQPLPTADLLVLPENRLAVTAVRRLARGVCRGTALPFSVLVLHGPGGTGKSHLARSLTQKVVRAASARTVQSLAANELTFAIDAETEYADLLAADLLVIEDLQHLAASAVSEFNRLLDERQRRRRPTLITANAGPAKLPKVPRKLLSRLVGGLVVALEPLSPASRKAVLIEQLQAKNVRLEIEALDWLAARPSGGSLRRMLGAVEALKARHRGRATPLTLEQVKKTLDDADPPLGVDRIIQRVAAAFGVKPKELLGPSRLRTVLVPRQVAMFLARDVALLSLPRIGAHFGGRDHSTVQNAVTRIRTAMADDRELAGTIRQLKFELA